MKKLILLFTGALMMQSCNVEIVVKPQTENNLTSELLNNVCLLSDTASLGGLTNDGRVYAIYPDQLKDLLAVKEKAIVYRWSPYNMENNIPVYFVQSYCDEIGAELYVITNEYAAAFTETDNVKNPIFSMNLGGYIATVTGDKYENRFYKELLGNKYNKKSHIYYFENGKFIETHDEIVNVKWENKWN